MMEKPSPQILNYFRYAKPEEQETMRAAHPTWFPMPPPVKSEIVVGSIEQSNTDKAVAFLAKWPTAFPHLSAIAIDPVTHEKGLIEGKSFPPDARGYPDWAAVHDWIEERQGKSNLYFSVNSLGLPMNKKAGKADIAEVVALHVDIDCPEGNDEATVDALVARVRAYKAAPSVIIKSGGGVQAFWLLQPADRIAIGGDETKARAAESYTRGLENDFSPMRGAKADRCHNVDRIMRLPFTTNIPDVKKLAKGRKPALATLEEFSDVRYPLATFKAAPSKDVVVSSGASSPGGGSVSVSGSVKRVNWDEAARHFNVQTVDGLREMGLQEPAALSLELGDNVEKLHNEHKRIGHRMTEGAYDSYSLVTQAIATALLEEPPRGPGLSFDQAAAVLSNPGLPGNKHVLRQKTEKERHRAVERALQSAAKGIANSKMRAEGDRQGVPRWLGGTKDEAGLYPEANVENTEIALRAQGISASLDSFSDRIIVSYGGNEAPLQESVGDSLTSRFESAARKRLVNVYQYDAGSMLLHDTLVMMATEHAHNSVLDYLASIKWDGTPRIDKWLTTYCKAEDTPLTSAIGRIHLVASVRRARQPGCKYDNILVMESGEGKNKSSAIKLMAGDKNFSDQSILGARDKEVQELVAGVWLYEIADLTGMTRAEIEHVKAFASRDTDRARPAYGRNTEWRKRRCTFWATTNDLQYLLSQTGNRRFLPVSVGTIDLVALARDRDQLWAEAAFLESKDGESIFLAESLWAAAGEEQEARRVTDLWEDVLENIPDTVTLDKGTPQQNTVQVLHHERGVDGDEIRVAAGTLLTYVLHVPIAMRRGTHGVRLATVMSKLGWQRHKGRKVYIDCMSVSGFWMPDYGSAAVQEECAAAGEAWAARTAQGTLPLAEEDRL